MKNKSRFPAVLAATAAIAMGMFGNAVASEADDTIEKTFRETYVYRTYLKDGSVKTEAKDGVVTLTGTVEEEFHKGLASETAGGIAGVTRVDNQLATTEEVSGETSDMWIRRKISLALLLRRDVSAIDTTVTVNKGVVTLTGVAASEAQKALTAEYASDIDKVVSVNNQMIVAAAEKTMTRTPGEIYDDATVTAHVKSTLLTHRSTSATKVAVITRDGDVTLTGIAKNSAERNLITKRVKDVNGVEKVDNQMTIAVDQTK